MHREIYQADTRSRKYMAIDLLICFALLSALSTIYVTYKVIKIIHDITNIIFLDTFLHTFLIEKSYNDRLTFSFFHYLYVDV